MFLGTWAKRTPDKPAIVRASTGEVRTYRELNDGSMRLAQYFWKRGLRRGDRVALFMENNLRFMEVIWAALRSGLEIVSINRYAKIEEATYIVNDSGAKTFITSAARADVAKDMPGNAPNCRHFLMCDGTVSGFESYEEVVSAQEAKPLEVEWMGQLMSYTSGTTGRPKGVVRKQKPDALVSDPLPVNEEFSQLYGIGSDTVYLSPAPLYHGAPIRFARAIQSVGGTVVMMEKFNELDALKLIEKFKVTHAQWVPTMFVRMLRLPEEDKQGIDLSSLRVAIHAAAPCPVEVKRQMIDWWGPIIHEYYGATDGMGDLRTTSEEWLAHPGSVGKGRGIVRICDGQGNPLPPGEPGLIYWEANGSISYLNDPEKTKSAQNPKDPNLWTTGDIGYMDEEGYVFLTGRRGYTIISGGVNIYPQAIEDALIQCDKVHDAAVIGVPNAEMGEEVKAVVQLSEGVAPSPETAREIIDFAKSKISAYMVPKSVDFIEELPRLPTGKLYKQLLLEKYWPNTKRS
jgi:fatty-acyl-CoA synthase